MTINDSFWLVTLILSLYLLYAGLLLGEMLRAGRLELALSPMLMLAALLFTYVPRILGLIFNTGPVALALMGAYVFGLRPLVLSVELHRLLGRFLSGRKPGPAS